MNSLKIPSHPPYTWNVNNRANPHRQMVKNSPQALKIKPTVAWLSIERVPPRDNSARIIPSAPQGRAKYNQKDVARESMPSTRDAVAIPGERLFS